VVCKRPIAWCVRSWWKCMQKGKLGWDMNICYCYEIFVNSGPYDVFCPKWTHSFTIISGNLLHRIDQKKKTKWFQRSSSGNDCFELTHLLQSHNRVNWIFLWYFSEFSLIRCVQPELDKLLCDNIWQSSAQNRSKEGKTKAFQTCSSCNACFELTHLLRSSNRVF